MEHWRGYELEGAPYLSLLTQGWVGVTQGDEWGWWWDKGGMYQTQSIPFLGGEQLGASAAGWGLLRELLDGQPSLAVHCWDGRRRTRGEEPFVQELDSSLKSLYLKPFRSVWYQLINQPVPSSKMVPAFLPTSHTPQLLSKSLLFPPNCCHVEEGNQHNTCSLCRCFKSGLPCGHILLWGGFGGIIVFQHIGVL